MGHWWQNLTPFGEILYARIAEAGLKPADFARQVDMSTSQLSQIRSGKLKPPRKRLDHWADLLGLKGEKREYFLDIAELTTASPRLLAMLDPTHSARPAINEAQVRLAESAAGYDASSLLEQELAARVQEIARLHAAMNDLQARLDQVRQAAGAQPASAAPPRPTKKA